MAGLKSTLTCVAGGEAAGRRAGAISPGGGSAVEVGGGEEEGSGLGTTPTPAAARRRFGRVTARRALVVPEQCKRDSATRFLLFIFYLTHLGP